MRALSWQLHARLLLDLRHFRVAPDISDARIKGAVVNLVDDVILGRRLYLLIGVLVTWLALLAPVADWTIALVGRLGDLVEVKVADVDVGRFLVAGFGPLQAVIAHDTEVLLILALMSLLDRLRRFNG